MTGVRILSVVTPGSLHWTHAAGQGVVTDFVLVDSGSDAVWLRLPESVAGSPNGRPEYWQEFQLGGEAEMWSWSFDDELKLWHPVTVTFDGLYMTESSDPNPFLDYRLNVTFSHPASGEEIIVPGYFAADGWATETGGSSGSGWRVHFLPWKTGEWLFEPTDKVGGRLSTMPRND